MYTEVAPHYLTTPKLQWISLLQGTHRFSVSVYYLALWCNSAVVILDHGAPHQLPLAQLCIRTSNIDVHFLYSGNTYIVPLLSAWVFGWNKKQHFCYSEQISSSYTTSNKHEIILHALARPNLVTCKSAVILVLQLQSSTNKFCVF